MIVSSAICRHPFDYDIVRLGTRITNRITKCADHPVIPFTPTVPVCLSCHSCLLLVDQKRVLRQWSISKRTYMIACSQN